MSMMSHFFCTTFHRLPRTRLILLTDSSVDVWEEDMDKKEKEEKEICFAKILKMTKYTSLPNLVRLGQWEQVSGY